MTTLTKQHFQAIASILKSRLGTTNDKEAMKQLLYLANELADYFVTTNEHFDYNRFVEEAGFTKTQLRTML